MKVLVIEDDRSIQMVLELVLTRMAHCQVLLALDGPQGLAMLQEHKPDLVLLDLMLPGLDGFEILRRAKAAPELQHIPVIILTAQAQKAAVVKGLSMGAAAYLVKPFDPVKIVSQINEALARVKASLLE